MLEPYYNKDYVPNITSLSTGSGAVNVWRLGGRKAGFVEFRNLTKHSAGAGCVKFAGTGSTTFY